MRNKTTKSSNKLFRTSTAILEHLRVSQIGGTFNMQGEYSQFIIKDIKERILIGQQHHHHNIINKTHTSINNQLIYMQWDNKH